MERCNCGRTYETATGAALCEANSHGRGKDKYGDRSKFTNTIETEVVAVCAECLTPLRSYLIRVSDDRFEVNVQPHVCELPEAEE
jgi:hypothetical protein